VGLRRRKKSVRSFIGRREERKEIEFYPEGWLFGNGWVGQSGSIRTGRGGRGGVKGGWDGTVRKVKR